jgi:hypothetical protein
MTASSVEASADRGKHWGAYLDDEASAMGYSEQGNQRFFKLLNWIGWLVNWLVGWLVG